MNAYIFSFSLVVLGIMTGISGNHFLQVKEMVSRGGELAHSNISAQPEKVASIVPAEVQKRNEIVKEPTPARADLAAVSSQKNDALAEILKGMRAEQKKMRNQLAETNRALAEATFRLDSYSDSFKPLHSTPTARPRSLDVLIADSEGVLPPKP